MLSSARQTNSKHLWLLLAALVLGVLYFLRDIFLLNAFGYLYAPDSPGYIQLGSDFRMVPYPLLNTILNTPTQPIAVILLQIIIAACAFSVITYTVSRINSVLGIVIGIFLLADMVWALLNLELLTESLFTSFHLLALACLLNQYQHRSRLSRLRLVGAGILYALAFAIRPANLFLLLPVLLVYWSFLKPKRRAAWLGVGMGFVLLCIALLNLGLYGRFQVMGKGGFFLAFSLHSYRLFSPDNGPYSQEADRIYKSCDPDFDYDQIDTYRINDTVYGFLSPCFRQNGYTDEQFADYQTAMYKEAVLKKPLYFVQQVIENSALALSFPVSVVIVEDFKSTTIDCSGFLWCSTLWTKLGQNEALKEQIMATEHSITQPLFRARQLYLGVAERLSGTTASLSDWMDYTYTPFQGIALICWLVLNGVLLLATRGVLRLLILACFVFIQYTVFSAITGNIFIPRYAEPLSPFYTIVSVTALWLLFDILLGRLRAQRRKRVQRSLHI